MSLKNIQKLLLHEASQTFVAGTYFPCDGRNT